MTFNISLVFHLELPEIQFRGKLLHESHKFQKVYYSNEGNGPGRKKYLEVIKDVTHEHTCS